MPIVIPIKLSGEQAEAELKKFQEEWSAKFGVELEVETDKAKEGLGEVKDKAAELSDTVKRIELRDVMEKAVDKIGDVKDIIEKTGVSMFGLSESTVETVVAMGDLAEKGASLGSAFGVWGTVIGGAIGAAWGYLSETNRLAAETEKNIEELTKESRAAVSQFSSLGRTDLSAVITQLTELEAKMASIRGGPSKETQENIEKLAGQISGALANSFGKAAAIAKDDEFGTMGKSAAQLTARIDELNKAIGTNVGFLEGQQKTLNELKSKGQELAGSTYKALEGSMKSTSAEVVEQKKELAALKDALEKITPPAKEVEEQTKKLPGPIKEIGQAAKESTPDILAFVDAVIRARQETKEFGDKVLGELEADLGSGPRRTIAGAVPRSPGAGGGRGSIIPMPTDEEAKKREEKYQEALDQYSGYVSAFASITNELTSTLESNIAQGNRLFDGMGAAAERGVSQVLKALGREFKVKAIAEAAAGFASLAVNDADGAKDHFIAAAGYGAAAVAASVGGAVLGGDASRRDSARNETGGGSGGGSFGGSSSSNRFSDPGTQQLAPLVINYYSTVPPTERGAQQQAEVIDSLLRKKGGRRG